MNQSIKQFKKDIEILRKAIARPDDKGGEINRLLKLYDEQLRLQASGELPEESNIPYDDPMLAPYKDAIEKANKRNLQCAKAEIGVK